jgi:hypothetical protein
MMVRKKTPKLVTQYLEKISREALENHFDVVTRFIGRRNGVYALFRKGKLYYVGLASDLRGRLKSHMKDHHGNSWDSFSVYLTIGDQHLRELESLMLRIAEPPGNRQLGKFAGAQSISRQFKMALVLKKKKEIDGIFGVEQEEDEVRPLLAKPKSIRGTLKGETFKARLRRDLTVRFGGKVYPSPSAAAKAACKRPANGWWFWHYERSPGDWVRIDALRS